MYIPFLDTKTLRSGYFEASNTAVIRTIVQEVEHFVSRTRFCIMSGCIQLGRRSVGQYRVTQEAF